MRKIVAGFAASIDGYIEGPNGEYDWILIDKEIDFTAHMKRFDTFLYGRRSYEAVAAMNNNTTPGIKNYVFSKTLSSVKKNFILIKEDMQTAINQLKTEEGKDIAIFGGASLLASLLDHRLVDEISISFIPVLLGKGKPMVDMLKERVWLTYKETKTYSNGTIIADYTVRYTKPD